MIAAVKECQIGSGLTLSARPVTPAIRSARFTRSIGSRAFRWSAVVARLLTAGSLHNAPRLVRINTRKWGKPRILPKYDEMQVHHKCEWFFCMLPPNQGYARLLPSGHDLVAWFGLARDAERCQTHLWAHNPKRRHHFLGVSPACYGLRSTIG